MSKAIKVSCLSLLLLFAFSQPSIAENKREFADIYSDCGLGALIAPKNSGVAAATNVIWDSGTTAISSNISSPESCEGGKEKVAAFIYDSYESIEKDLASGSGTHLDALLVLVGYDFQENPQFIDTLRQDFATMVVEKNYFSNTRFEKAENLYNLVQKQAGEIS
jgi:Protein of unknown function (DUF3015)